MAAYGVDRGRGGHSRGSGCWLGALGTVRKMGNPLGYCFRVGQSRTRPHKMRVVYSVPGGTDRWVEPRLPEALASLPKRQRVAVVLSCGYGLPVSEVAELMRSRPSTVQTHVARGLAGLRRSLKRRQTRLGQGSSQSVWPPAAAEDPTGGTAMDDLPSSLPDQIRALFPGDSAAVSVEEAMARAAHGTKSST